METIFKMVIDWNGSLFSGVFADVSDRTFLARACFLLVTRMVFQSRLWHNKHGTGSSSFSDWDFCKRARDNNWATYYIVDAKAIHHERKSFEGKRNIALEVRYKVDGWRSTERQIEDRFIFLRKHLSPVPLLGVKAIHFLRNLIRIGLVVCDSMSARINKKEATFRLNACLRTIVVILRT